MRYLCYSLLLSGSRLKVLSLFRDLGNVELLGLGDQLAKPLLDDVLLEVGWLELCDHLVHLEAFLLNC